MARINFTKSLAVEYQRLYDSCEIRSDKFNTIDKLIDSLVKNRKRYENVGRKVGVPWFFIAVIHNMESGLNFTRHLHNGDRLTARTRQIPIGRPKAGMPPFTWEESALDALKLKGLHKIKNWNLPRILYELESYNGWGYRLYHPEVLSPYLWSFSSHYHSGKYVADGRWSHTAVSRQSGAAILIRRLEERHIISTTTITETKKVLLRYSPRAQARADDLQRFLNTFPGIHLRVDAIAGKVTSAAVEKVFGFKLKGDSRSKKPDEKTKKA
ncbi:MAG: hypothetical protein AB8D52_03635 [Gammaproteobacteria bacterium]